VCSAFAAAFLIREKQMSVKAALRLIHRKCGTKPNQGFVMQLNALYQSVRAVKDTKNI
jgi:hypothetical protein